MENIPIRKFITLCKKLPLIDVRTQAEFANGHITGAINIPIFSNEERAVVGTKYKKESKDTAIAQALEYIAEKIDKYLAELKKLVPSQEIGIYCWRGGFRSTGMGHLFQTAGKKIYRLEGGYKIFRNYVLDTFKTRYDLIVIGGMTGSGKSEILEKLAARGEQIIDLEGVANHKGSAFGALGEDDQPTIQQFENDLSAKLESFDPNEKIWLEDESRMIGKVKIPDDLFKQIRNSWVVKVEVPKEERRNRLIKEYANFSKADLINSVSNISRRLGGLNTKLAIESIEKEDYSKAIDIVLNYYDKAYNYGLSKREQDKIFPVKIKWENIEPNVDHILKIAKEKLK